MRFYCVKTFSGKNDSSGIIDSCSSCGRSHGAYTTATINKIKDLAMIFDQWLAHHDYKFCQKCILTKRFVTHVLLTRSRLMRCLSSTVNRTAVKAQSVQFASTQPNLTVDWMYLTHVKPCLILRICSLVSARLTEYLRDDTTATALASSERIWNNGCQREALSIKETTFSAAMAGPWSDHGGTLEQSQQNLRRPCANFQPNPFSTQTDRHTDTHI